MTDSSVSLPMSILNQLTVDMPTVRVFVIWLIIFFRSSVFLRSATAQSWDESSTHGDSQKNGAFEVPTKPENVSLLWVTDSMMEISWSEPQQSTGKLEGYRIYFTYNNFTNVVTLKESMRRMRYALQNLDAFTEYKIWVTAFTFENEGQPSAPIVVRTDVRGPEAPRIVNISCVAEDTLYIQWQRPTKYFNSIDYYYISYRDDKWMEFEEIVLPARNPIGDESIFLHNLTANVMYEIRVRGGTRSLMESEKVYKGQFSDSKRVLLKANCVNDYFEWYLPRASNEFTPAMVAISFCASFVLLFLVTAGVIWRRCFQGEYYYLDDPSRPSAQFKGSGWHGDSSAGEHKSALPSRLFIKHVRELHADGDIGFSKEYEAIQTACVEDELTAEFSQHPDNKPKNRYLNIVAYDHSRVRLQPVRGQNKILDYVNANYIDGFQKPHAYIGTQGPLPSTFDTFWRMVWDHNVHIIVMITNLVERGRKKCDMYWPSEGSEIYGVIQVKLINEDVMATYTVRKFTVCQIKVKKKKRHASNERTVYHYHYTNWPDHGTPNHPLPVLSFVKKSSFANPVDAGPIIVHCSAGVGRTGTYIVLDTMLRQIRVRGDLNVFSFLHHIRTQRNFLVQTEEQYIFTHDALVEAIESGDTLVNKSSLSEYINTLVTDSCTDDDGEISTISNRQFKLITKLVPKEFQISAALKPCNLEKNRNSSFVGVDSFRVLLTPKPGIEGSDYINASFIPGLYKLQEFVITQHPLNNTVSEFWQMLWDHNIQLVVLLSAVDDEYSEFWPSDVDNDLDVKGCFGVHFVQENHCSGFVIRDFNMFSVGEDYELQVKFIHSPNWPHHLSEPASHAFDLIRFVQKFREECLKGPVAIVDQYGATEAATFSALTTLYNQMLIENNFDVYLYAKLYHDQRPGVWKSVDDVLFLYRCLEAVIQQELCEEEVEEELSCTPLPVIIKQGTEIEYKENGAATKVLSTDEDEATDSSEETRSPSHKSQSEDESAHALDAVAVV